MKRGDITELASLLHSMQDHVNALEEAKNEKELEKFNSIKKEILGLKSRIDKLL